MNTAEFENYLASISGLVNGFHTEPPKLLSRAFFSFRDGWLGIVHDLIEELIAAGWNKELCQAKEKFGGLRFYTNELPEAGTAIIAKYEKQSTETCERCGKPGTLRTDRSWMKTLCDEHAELKAKP